jgi:hypothetical protein
MCKNKESLMLCKFNTKGYLGAEKHQFKFIINNIRLPVFSGQFAVVKIGIAFIF